MPGYVSFLGGVGAEGSVATRRRTLGAAVIFVAGFALVFTAMGGSASALGGFLLRNREIFIRMAGVFVIIMGLVTVGIIRIGWLMRERRFPIHKLRPGPVGALPLGMAFAVGWTPCIGPILASILAVAATSGSAAWGATLLFVYSLGLGVPFLLLALGVSGENRAAAWLRRHSRGAEMVGGVTLVLMGVLMITGYWLRLFVPVLRLFSRLNWPPL